MMTLLRRCLAAVPVLLGCAFPAAAQPVPGEADLVYARVGGVDLTLDLYAPRLRLTPRPVIVWLHDGDWGSGSNRVLPDYLQPLYAEGYAIAAVRYRLTSEAGTYGNVGVTFPGQLHDVKAAVRFLRAIAPDFGLAPERIVAWGAGGGGHLAALLGTTADLPELEGTLGEHLDVSSRVSGVVAYGAPTDLLQLGPDADAANIPFDLAIVHDAPTSPASRLIGYDAPGQGLGVLRANASAAVTPFPLYRNLVAQASPVASASPGDAPMFIASGTLDRFVPAAQGRRLVTALTAVGVEASFKEVEATSPAAFGEGIHETARDFVRSRIGASTVVVANPVALSGTWFDPATSGQGFDFLWLDGNRLLVNFFGHRDDGSNLGLFGLHEGVLRYTQAVEIPLIVATNGRFNQLDAAAIRRESWGTLTLQFDSCNRAIASLRGRDGDQFLALQKLAAPPGKGCD
jgi:acetyl esterase/lipase